MPNLTIALHPHLVTACMAVPLNPLTGDQTYMYSPMYGNWMHEQISIDFQKDFQ